MRSNHAINKTSKLARAILGKVKNVRVYSLSNNFSGEAMAEVPVRWRDNQLVNCTQPEVLTENLHSIRSARLYNQGNHYVIHVHSNLWYEFESDGSLYDVQLCMRPSFLLQRVLERLYNLPYPGETFAAGVIASIKPLEDLKLEFEKVGR